MKKIIITILVIAVQVICISISHAETEIIDKKLTILEDTTWEGVKVINGVQVTVAQNATLTIKPGTIISAKNGALIYVMGKLKARGEEDKKIRFTAEHNEKPNFSLYYYIDSTSESEIVMENFILEGGGGNMDIASPAALTLRGKADISGGLIRRNLITAIRVWGNNVKIENCEIYENEYIAVENKSTTNSLKAEDNWWGSEEGPTANTIPNSPRAYIKGAIDFEPFEKKGPIPIVIIPGLGGSFSFKLFSDKAKDEWWLPTLGSSAYRYFAKALILSNYYHDKDFFWGFYDWRMASKDSSKKYLEKVIEDAREKSGHSQVHIVAHSMGGLVARSYIEGDEFRDDVDRLVAAGTPHLGSSETYPVWEGGELTNDKKSLYLYLWYLQALNGNWNSPEFIRKNFPSIGEMMPIYDYLENSFDGHPISYKSQKEHNKFLEDLSDSDNLSKLKRKVNTWLVVGDGKQTLEKIKVAPHEDGDSKWADGIPDPLDPPKDTDKGDGTVTTKSARADEMITKNIITLDSDHSQLLQSGTKPIFEQLKVKAKFPLLFKLMSRFLLTAKGPADVAIEDNQGKFLSAAKNEIEDSQFHEQAVEDNKLIFSDFPVNSNSEEEAVIRVSFIGKAKGDLRAAFWSFPENDSYSKEEVDTPLTKGMELTYEIKFGEETITFSTVTTLKSMMVLVNRLYEEEKIINWHARSQLINKLAEAYQDFSNDRISNAKVKAKEARDTLIAYDNSVFTDLSAKDSLAESLKNLEDNPM